MYWLLLSEEVDGVVEEVVEVDEVEDELVEEGELVVEVEEAEGEI